MPRLPQSKRDVLSHNARRHILTYKAERAADGIDSAAIAAALGFTKSTLQNRIKEPQKLTVEELGRIANTLNISVATLLGI